MMGREACMKAWMLARLGGIGELKLQSVADPRPGRGEVLLRVRYASLNPADRHLADGRYPAKPALPHILGRDGVGDVVEVGEGVASIQPGDRLAILRSEIGVNRWGTFAELVAVPMESLVQLPAGWDEQEV